MHDQARAWLADDPDPQTRAELQRWLDEGDDEALFEAFRDRLQFGTAGIRGPLGAGPNRMNLRVVRQTAAGVGAWLGGGGTVVVAHDARHRSRDFAVDAARVLAGVGCRAILLPGPLPTPVLAFAVPHLACAAGIMVTASHNPPRDNGIKVYDGSGAQIVPPVDVAIAARVAEVTSVTDLPMGDPIEAGVDVLDAYVTAAAARVPDGPRDVVVVHTAMHGVATDPLRRLLDRAAFAEPIVVAEQADPDPDFPTVAFPNPEEPGALDLALARAAAVDADAVIANDPDGDRLAACIVDGDRWRPLTGDELGILLADQALAATSGDDRLVASSLVSSTMLGRLAAAHGVPWETTLTGFKWIARATDAHPGSRLVFGYEEALGYAVHDLVRDKDGLTAAAAFTALAARLKAEDRTVAQRLEELMAAHGLHATRQWSLRLEGAAGAARIAEAVTSLAAAPPDEVAGRRVVAVERPATDVIVLVLDGDARAVVRPSGTEPKLKVYLQVVRDDADRAAADADLEALRVGVADLLGLRD